MHGDRATIVSVFLKIVTGYPVIIAFYVSNCDGPITNSHKVQNFVTDCDGPVTINLAQFFWISVQPAEQNS